MPNKGNQQIQQAIRIKENGFESSQCNLEQFTFIDSSYITMKGTKKQKAQQICDDIPIFGACIVVESNDDGSNAVACSGIFYQCNEIKLDLLKSDNKINSEQAIQYVISPQLMSTITSQTVQLNIYITSNTGLIYLAWILDIVGTGVSGVYSWFAIVDSASGYILEKIDTIQRIQKVRELGGNYKSGAKTHEFVVTSYPELRNENIIVKDYNSKDIIECASTSDCVDDEVNGGLGPAGDAFQYGNDVFNLYNDWYFESTPLDPALIPVILEIYLDEANAYFIISNGSAIVWLGNGDSNYFHPYTDLNLVAHELSHGFTKWKSQLIYRSESGGLAESYADLVGQAAESYVRKYNHWRVGYDVTKGTGSLESLRWMYDPSIDGRPDQWNPFVGELNVHVSSGVYNKFYYLLYSYGWNTKQIFQMATKANEIYWLPFEEMNSGACGVLQAAVDLFGENESMLNDVKQAFKTVNVVCDPHSEFNVVEIYTDLSTDNITIVGQYNHENTLQLRFSIDGPNGDADLYVKYGEPPTLESYDCTSTSYGSREICQFVTTKIGIYYWLIHPFTMFTNLTFAISEGPESIEPPIAVETHTELASNLSQITGQYNNTEIGVLQITISGGTGDADLYVKFGEPPTLSVFDCRPFVFGNEETCKLHSKVGIYYWMLDPFEPFSNVTLTIFVVPDTRPDFKEFDECTFEPLDIEDRNMWKTLVYNNGNPWLITQNENKLWISSYELTRREITILLSKFCSVLNARFITVTARASGSGPNKCDTYRLMVEFKNDEAEVVYTFDTGFVETKSYFKEYVAEYHNFDGNVTTITISEWGNDAENNTFGYYGTSLKLPVIHVSSYMNGDDCFIGCSCSSTNDCCPDGVDKKENGIKCHRKRKICCVKYGYSGCLHDNDCCSKGSLCYDGVCKSHRHRRLLDMDQDNEDTVVLLTNADMNHATYIYGYILVLSYIVCV